MEVGFHIPIVSRFLDSALTSGFQSPGLRIPRAKISHIPESWRDSESHLNGNTIGFPPRIFKFFSVTNNLSTNEIFLGAEEFFSIVALKEHVRGITGVISIRIRGLFGGISTLITVA